MKDVEKSKVPTVAAAVGRKSGMKTVNPGI